MLVLISSRTLTVTNLHCSVLQITKKEIKRESQFKSHPFRNFVTTQLITNTIHVEEAETKWETLSNEDPGAVPRCPPSRALGHYQREVQAATSAVASDEAEAVLSRC